MKPLCTATHNLLRPVDARPNDFLEISYENDKFTVEQYALINGERRFPSWQTSKFWRRFPEAHQVTHGLKLYLVFEVPASDYSVALLNCWPKHQRSFVDETTEVAFKTLLLHAEAEDKNAERTAAYKNDASLPKSAKAFDNILQHELTPFQKVALVNAYYSRELELFMEQGTGKTPIVIALTNYLASRNNFSDKSMFRLLVVCPKNVRENWVKEFQKFATVKGKATILSGDAIGRMKKLVSAFQYEEGCRYSVVIMSYDLLSRYFLAKSKEPNPLQMVQWNLAVLDESHYIKSPRAQRTKAAWRLRDYAEKRMILTGTPIANSFFDLYAQWEFLSKYGSGFSSYTKFKEFYGSYVRDRSGEMRLTDYQNIPFLKERLARKSFMISKKEALPYLPKKVYDTRWCDPTEEQAKAYSSVLTTLRYEIESDIEESDSKQLTVNNVLTRLLRLAQITSGFLAWDEVVDDIGNVVRPQQIDRFDPDPKLEELVDIIRELPSDEKALVWSCWTQNIRTIAARLRLEGIDCVTFMGSTSDEKRAEAEERFNCDPQCRVFIGNPAAGGTGLNLLGYDLNDPEHSSTDCTQEVYYSQGWSAIHRSQSEDRAHRKGTRRQVRITDLCMRDTIDAVIRSRVVEKRRHAYEISDIREILAEISMETSTVGI